jgi:hypothetical protein
MYKTYAITSLYPIILPSGPSRTISNVVRDFDGSNTVNDTKSGSRSNNLTNKYLNNQNFIILLKKNKQIYWLKNY